MNSFTADPSLSKATKPAATPGFFPDPTLSQNKGNVTPSQAATALGHSNSLLMTHMGSSGVPIASNPSFGGEMNELGKEIPQVAGGIANSALKFAQSAVQAPTDIAAGLQGKQPNTQTLPNFSGEGQKTIQGDAVQTASDVFDRKTSPLAGTFKAIGDTIGGALNFIGGGAGGKAAEDAAPAVVKGVEDIAQKGVSTAKNLVENRSTKLATTRLSSTGETMTKGEREAAIKEGRMSNSGKYTPSSTETRAGEIMKGKTFSNPVKTVSAIKNEIASRGKEAETYLEQNSTKITNEEDNTAFNAAKASAEKYMTPAESNAYDEQIGVFQKILKGYTKGDGYTTANYYKALKDYESQVTANLPKGKDALLVPGGSARIQGAKDVRSVVRNMIGTKNPEFKGKMFDLASLYDAQDNVVAKAEQGGHSWVKRHPRLTTAAAAAGGIAAEQFGVSEVKKLLP